MKETQRLEEDGSIGWLSGCRKVRNNKDEENAVWKTKVDLRSQDKHVTLALFFNNSWNLECFFLQEKSINEHIRRTVCYPVPLSSALFHVLNNLPLYET